MTDENLTPLEYVSGIRELQALCDFADNSDLDNSLDNVVKLIARIKNREVIEPAKVSRLLVLLSAYTMQLGMKFLF